MKSAILSFFICSFILHPLSARELPNIIYILADDLGYGDVSVNNPRSKIQTPHIDRLASEGIRFTDAHTPDSVCTPTRYAIMTGQYCWRTPLKQGVTWSYGRVFLEEGKLTVASLLKQHGYNTAVIGKWHLGLDWGLKTSLEKALADPDNWDNRNGLVMNMNADLIDFTKPIGRGPKDFGFDYSYVLPASLDIPPYCYVENHRVVEVPSNTTQGNDLDQGYAMAFWREGKIAPGFDFYDVLPNFARRAVDYIEDNADSDEPFFLYLPLAAPHTPWVPTDDYNDTSGAGMYGDFVQMVDAEVGRILDALRDEGIEENTLVIFTSDNGPYWLPNLRDRYDHDAAYHYRGMKGDIWEGGHRVPYIVRWPRQIEAGKVTPALTSLTHFMATCADILQLPDPDRYGEDSSSVLPVFMGISDTVPGQPGIMMHSSNAHFAYRLGDWKYIEKRGSGGFSNPVSFNVRQGEPTAQLYNLKSDPSESRNLFYKEPEKVDEMQRKLNLIRGGDAASYE